MVEVFRTNVTSHVQANLLIDHMRDAFKDYEVNFDLEDCDNILRVEYQDGVVDSAHLVVFLKALGCMAEVLPDEANLLAG